MKSPFMPTTIRLTGHLNQTSTNTDGMATIIQIHKRCITHQHHKCFLHHRPSMATQPRQLSIIQLARAISILDYNQYKLLDRILKLLQCNTSQSRSQGITTKILDKTTIPQDHMVMLVLPEDSYMVTLVLAIQARSPQRLIPIKMLHPPRLHHRHHSNHRFNYLLTIF